MKPLLKIMAILALTFLSTFIVLKLAGLLTVEQIETTLTAAQQIDGWYLAAIIAGLLFLDLFIAVPTLTIMLLAGYFLGAGYGAVAALSGIYLAGICGYWLSYRYGGSLEKRIIRAPQERLQLRKQFNQYGVVMILLCRALPVLPEVTACMSGLSKMPFGKFLLAWSVSCVPYTIIATYAGSISSVQNPKPAIFTTIGLTGLMWLGWWLVKKVYQPQPISPLTAPSIPPPPSTPHSPSAPHSPSSCRSSSPSQTNH